MPKRSTIKDIAEQAGVSLRSVHCALNGKPGVGEETRARILDIAHTLEYRPNLLASSLKRKAIRIGAAFPGPTEANRFYFSQVWEGIRDYLKSIRDFKVDLIEMPFYNEWNDHAAGLDRLLEKEKVEGLLTVGNMDAEGRAALRRFDEKRVPVALIGTDIPNSNRLCCVMPNYDVIGRVMAELLTERVGDGGILLCAGDVVIPSHFLVVLGFEAYMRETGLRNPVYKVYGTDNGEQLRERILRQLAEHPDIAGCASVNARGSVRLGLTLREAGLAGGMPAIASDLFEENVAFLKSGVFNNIIHKNPYSQSYIAAKHLVDFILLDVPPPHDLVYVGSDVVLKSNLSMFDAGRLTPEAMRL